MKTLTIPASRLSVRDTMRSISATVSTLRSHLDARACLTVAIAAIIVFFVALGAMHVPSIVASGLTALSTAAIAPSAKEGGAL